MIIYKRKKKQLVIPCGLGPVVCEDTNYELQMKQVDSSTVQQHVEPDEGYYGLYRVIVNPYTTEWLNRPITGNGTYVITPENADTLSGVEINVDVQPNLQGKTVDSSTVSQNVTADSGYDGLSSVNVNPYTLENRSQVITVNGEYTVTPVTADGLSSVDISVNVADIPAVLQAKTADASTETQVITPDEGYDGLSQVTVDPYTLESKSDTITDNGVYAYYPNTADGLDQVIVDVSVDTVNNQSKTVDSSTVSQNVTPDNGYTGLDNVTVNPYVLDTKTVDSSTVAQTVTSDEDGLSSVTVNPYTVENKTGNITSNGQYIYTADNADALNQVTVDVSVDTVNNQSKTVDSSTTIQYVQPDQGYTGLDYVAVNPYTTETDASTLTHNGQYVFTPTNADALSQVTVDVSINTVNNQNKTVNSSTVSQNVTPDTGYTGLDSVTVNPYVLDTKTVDSSTVSQTIISDEDGLSQVTVNPYILDTKTVDSSTVSQIITSSEDGISQVTVNPYVLDAKTVDSSTVSQTITSDEDGLSSVTVNPYVLDAKTVDSSTVSQTITSDEDGLSSVTVNPYTTETDSSTLTHNGQYVFTPTNADALSQVTVDVSINTVNNQNKTTDSSTVSQTITPDTGYTGLDSVTVNPYVLDTKTVNSSTAQQVITSNEDGLSSVTVNPYVLDTKTVDSSTVSQTITSDEDGLSSVTVNPYTTETDSSTLTANGQYVFTPTNADALSQVTVDVSINTVNNQSKTVNSSTVSQNVTPDNGYTGLDNVTVNPYVLDAKTVDSSTVSQTITSDEDGLSSVTVNPYVLDAKTVDSSTVQQVVTSDVDGLSSVTVNPYTIKLQEKYIIANGYYGNLDSSILPDASYDGLGSVNIDPVPSLSDILHVHAFGNGDQNIPVNRYVSTVSVDDLILQSKIVCDYGPGTDASILPDAGYDGFWDIRIRPNNVNAIRIRPNTGEVTWDSLTQHLTTPNADEMSPNKNVNRIYTERVMLQSNKNVDSSTVQQVITFDDYDASLLAAHDVSSPEYINNRYQGLKQVTVNPYTTEVKNASISANGHYTYTPTTADALSQVNIDVSIKTAPDLQSKTVDSSTAQQVVQADQNYDGLSQVTVNPYTTETDSSTLTSNGTYEFTADNADALSKVTVNVSVNTVNNQSKTANSSTVQQSVTPDNGYTGLSNVTIYPYTTETDSSTLTANGQYIFTPTNADALSQVTVDVSINTVNNQAKTANSSTVSQTVSPDNGYTGLSTVTINPYTVEADSSTLTANGHYEFEPQNADAISKMEIDVSVDTVNNQSKSANSSTSSQTITPDQGYTGLSSVTINPYTTEAETDTITVNGRYEYTALNADALSSVIVDVSVEGQVINNQSKTVNSSTVGQTVAPDYNLGYTGLGKVDVMPYVLDTSTVNPSINTIIVTSTVDGLSQVTVNAVNHAIDSNIAAGNIREGVEILGVEGTYAGTNQSKTVDSSTVSQDVTPDNGYTGLGKVTVNPYVLDTKTVDSSTVSQTITSSEDGLSSVTVNPYKLQTKGISPSQVVQAVYPDNNYNGLSMVQVGAAPLEDRTVDASTASKNVTARSSYYGLGTVTINAVTSSIDSNIQAGNIKDGVTILGVTGTYEGTVINNQSKTVNPSTNEQIVTPDNGYTGLSSVTVNPNAGELHISPFTYADPDSSVIQSCNGYATVKVDMPYAKGKTITPTTYAQTFRPYMSDSCEYYGLVKVNAVDATIDANIQAGNIKDGVTILGVTGSYAGTTINNQNKTVDASTVSQTVTFDSSYTGLGIVTISPYSLYNPDLTLYMDYPYVVSSYSSKSASAYGVDGFGTVYWKKPRVTSKTVDASTVQQTFNPNDEQYSYYTGVTVNAVTSSIDSNIAAGNIKSGVTILGVTGSYTGEVADYDTIYNALIQI